MSKESKHHMLKGKKVTKNANNDVFKVWIDKKKVQDDIFQNVRTPWVIGFRGTFIFLFGLFCIFYNK